MGHQPNRDALEQELVDARGLFDDWRRQRKALRQPIPASLWEKAAELAGRYGVGVIAAGLRLDHAKLKSRLLEATKAATPPMPVRRAEPGQTTFVELFSTTPSPSEAPALPSRPIVRFRSPSGLQVRIDWGDSDVSGLAKLLKEVL